APFQTALGLEHPVAVGLHAGRPPDLLGAVVGQRPVGGGRDHRAKHARLYGRIVEYGPLRLNARQAAREFQDGARPPAGQGLLQAPGVGLSVVYLVPGHAGAHPHDIAERDPFVGRAAHPRQVVLAVVVQAADRTIVERRADERRGHRLRGRVALPTPLWAAARTVALQRDLAVLQDQQPHRAAAGHVVDDAAAVLAHVEGQVRERTGVRWKRPHRLAATDDAVRPPLLVADRRRLVLGCRVHCALPLRRRQIARGRRRLTKQVRLVWMGLVAQARSRLDSFRKITPPTLAKVHSAPTRTRFAELFTRVNW